MKKIILAIILCLSGITWSYGNNNLIDMTNKENIDLFNQHYKLGSEYLNGNVKLGDYDGKEIREKNRVDNLKKAIHEFDQCLEIKPDHWQSIFFKALAFQALGNHTASLSLMEQGIKLQPQNYVLYKEASLEAIHNHDISKALNYSKMATEVRKDDPQLLGNYAMNLLISGQDKESQQTIKYALSVAPDDRFNQKLQNIIKNVVSGKRSRPTVENVFN
ncbi:tetratricopeptide repeat protein [Solimicrobium silvestre]|uniref:Tetratricopeptide repeat n=1 Tax=Solimicrobium silvestre TaxID=2099400 RepID=A0A2S9GSW3_9BURK|nr:hypothetical protein [Solimicrobium silvestre]PRC90795.1 Tetratricopeptide repeat [Solimicrobium silvestre]